LKPTAKDDNMALFGNKETKEEKQARLEQEMLEANHLT
jgi:hypothetical protein